MKKDSSLLTILFCGLLFISSKVVSAQAIDSIPVDNEQQILLHSNALNEDRTIWIHTPPVYNSSTDNYPVLYLLDGGTHFKYVSEMVDYLSNFETFYIPEMIIVGIPNVDRGRDFTPKFDSDNGAQKFLNFIESELTPYIDKNYRTQPYRILEGHSLGGLFAIYTNEKAPNLFQASIIISPALRGGENNVKVSNDFATYLKSNTHLSNKLFLALGNENRQGVDVIINQLKRFAPKSFKWDFRQYKEENHFSVPYKSMYDGLRFIYSNWHIEAFLNPDKISYQDIESHYKQLSAEFGYSITPTEEFLNQCGYQQMRFKHIDEAIEIFKQNSKSHPNSFNVYDSLGEAYMIKGENVLAIENYAKSIALNPDNENGKVMLEKLKNKK